MTINCLIVDDELLARRLLTDYVGKMPELNLVGTCASAMEAQGYLQKQRIDLLLLDIQMPDVTGISLLRSLPNKPVTILTTAYAEYALQGYELFVLDYLLKPISFERFFQAASRAVEYIGLLGKKALPRYEEARPPHDVPHDYIFVKSDYKIHKIAHRDMDVIEAYGEYILIYSGGQKIMTLGQMGKLEQMLPKPGFVRVHRSFIVNFSKIDAIQGGTIHVGGREVPLSKGYRDAFMQLVQQSRLS
ncbi:LytR/AlgR family response regulator transcription factor [Dyadobacter fermentans]|uniref:Two component transcriptional regulator, LytTR family n=1 Tax=Dyadobacter fermentans (strain ATCC 700827 / DSM 18053 / CIP 107007 / KCTC 52180 / NS114) TaxID=471854 RepID=C6W252_DYAFD|nr:LytTR family DNA-binding domain-containing protein [Dyadobacter fermentans]ACT92025.1 two component transcriptional regulator, LytTR family [Dyadobacter fermentans DSM 18053]